MTGPDDSLYRPPEGHEFVGNMSFGPADDGPIVGESTLQDWLDRGRHEYMLSRVVVPILNATDEELAARIVSRDVADVYLGLLEDVIRKRDQYADGVKVMDAAAVRLMVVLERWITTNA